MAALNGRANGYPEGQCTVYADERYHDLTGYYVPWSANAKDWATQALAYGWSVSSKPVVPSICCLQGGIQGADATYGHVAVVESISKGTVNTSDLNWGPNYAQVSNVTFALGSGVSFIYATGANGRALGSSTNTLSDIISNVVGNGDSNSKISLAPTTDVTDWLLSMDAILELRNPLENINTTQSNIAGVASFTDPISWVEGFGLNLLDDIGALTIRSIFLIIGVIIILKVASRFIDFGAISQSIGSGAQTLAAGAAFL